MNSRLLKEKFEDKYKKFFSGHEVVLSLPYLINWTGDILPQYTGIHIKQKIPLRMYLGINRTKDKKIILKDVSYYDINDDQFKTSSIIKYFPYFLKYEDYFNKVYSNELGDSGIGFELSIFAEVPQGVSLGFPSVATFLFLLGIERIFGNIDTETYDGKLNDYLKGETFIKGIISKSLDLKKSLNSPICIATQINSYFDSAYPIVSFVDNEIENETFESNGIYGYRLNEIDEHISKTPIIHLDFGIAYCGTPVYIDNIQHKHKHAKAWMNTITNTIGELFGKDISEDNKPSFYKNLVENSESNIEDIYKNIMGTISLEVFYNMLKLFSSNYSETVLDDFVGSLDKARWGYYITQNSSNKFKDFVASMIINFDHQRKVIGIMPNDTTTYGGAISFILPVEAFRKQFLKSFEITTLKNPNASIIYTNWQDGIEEIGFRLEQDIGAGIYSEYCNSKTFVISNPEGKDSLLGDYEELLNIRKKGIIIDTLSKKILLNGEKLTSEELPSQQAAIALLEMLLVNPKKEISNLDLPKSSYSRNRNDMVGKIILPLNRLFEQNKTNISMSCRGSLSEYFIKFERLNYDGNNIYVLRKAR